MSANSVYHPKRAQVEKSQISLAKKRWPKVLALNHLSIAADLDSYEYLLADDHLATFSYDSNTAKRLSDYNMEAQGDIIADYFALKFLKEPTVVAEARYRSEGAIGIPETVLPNFLKDPSDEKNLP